MATDRARRDAMVTRAMGAALRPRGLVGITESSVFQPSHVSVLRTRRWDR
jgi:hypothetical protein